MLKLMADPVLFPETYRDWKLAQVCFVCGCDQTIGAQCQYMRRGDKGGERVREKLLHNTLVVEPPATSTNYILYCCNKHYKIRRLGPSKQRIVLCLFRANFQSLYVSDSRSSCRDIEDRDRKTAQVCFVRGGDQREKEVGREKGGERVPVPER